MRKAFKWLQALLYAGLAAGLMFTAPAGAAPNPPVIYTANVYGNANNTLSVYGVMSPCTTVLVSNYPNSTAQTCNIGLHTDFFSGNVSFTGTACANATWCSATTYANKIDLSFAGFTNQTTFSCEADTEAPNYPTDPYPNSGFIVVVASIATNEAAIFIYNGSGASIPSPQTVTVKGFCTGY